MSYSLKGGYPGDYNYSFEDSWNISQSPEEIFIDGQAIASLVPGFRTLNVSGRESLAYAITEQDRPVGMDGTEYFGRNMEGRTITVRFLLKRTSAQKFMESYQILKHVCTMSEELKLQFSDQPNCYYTGILKSVSEPDPGCLQVIGEMEFYCADPYLYEDVITKVTATPDWDNSNPDYPEFQSHLSAEIINDGSGEIYPTYRIQNNSITSVWDDGTTYSSQNNYIGIVHKGGAMELGDPEENNSTKPSLFNTGLSSASGKGFEGFVAVKDPSGATKDNGKRIHPFDSRCASNGTLGIMQEKHLTTKCDDFYGLTIQDSGSVNSGDLTYGGMRRYTLDDPAPDFYLWSQIQFVASKMGQVGILEVMLCDEDDEFLAGFGCVKDDFSGNKARFVCWVGSEEFKKFEFQTDSQKRKLNPFIDTGYEDIQKEGGRWRFYYGGKRYSTYEPDHEDKSVKYIYLYVGRFVKKVTSHKSNDVNIYAQIIGKIRANDMRSKNWTMIGNRYDDADVVEIDTETDSITLNGIPANSELVTGSVFAPLPPSTTYIDKNGDLQYEPITIDFYTSSWQEFPPTIEIEYRRRWL